MMVRRVCLDTACVLVSLAFLPSFLAAQDSYAIETLGFVDEGETTLEVGGTLDVGFSVLDGNGQTVVGLTGVAWRSTDPSVVQVRVDGADPLFATLTALSPGVASIIMTAVTPNGEQQNEFRAVRVPGQATPDSILPGTVETDVLQLTAQLVTDRYGAGTACFTAASAGSGLFVTTYSAIRGARSITLTVGGTQSASVNVAGYDIDADVAVLEAPNLNAQAMPISTDGMVPDPNWWIAASRNCATPNTSRRAIVDDGGRLGLASHDVQEVGGAVVDRGGQLVGIVSDSVLIPMGVVQPILVSARSAAAAGNTEGIVQVGARENHLYGTVSLSSPDVTVTTVRPLPSESHLWAGLETRLNLPAQFHAPRGRYEASLMRGGVVLATQDFAIQSNADNAVVLRLQPIAAENVVEDSGGGGGFPLPILIIGGLGAGAAAVFLAGGSEPETGRISFFIPIGN